MFDDDLIKEHSVKLVSQGGADQSLSFECRIPFYRALPLSCLETVDLAVNDRPVERERISVMLRGSTYQLNNVAELMDIWWGFTEAATFIARTDADLNGQNTGNSVKIDLSIRVRLPYLIPTNGVDRPNYDSSHVAGVYVYEKQ